MKELEDKDFRWSPGYAWRTCLTMMTKRLWILIVAMAIAMLCFQWMYPDIYSRELTLKNGPWIFSLLLSGLAGYFFMRGIINKSGINPLLTLLAELFFIAIVIGTALGVLHLLGADREYMIAALYCGGSMTFYGLWTLKEQE